MRWFAIVLVGVLPAGAAESALAGTGRNVQRPPVPDSGRGARTMLSPGLEQSRRPNARLFQVERRARPCGLANASPLHRFGSELPTSGGAAVGSRLRGRVAYDSWPECKSRPADSIFASWCFFMGGRFCLPSFGTTARGR